MIPTLSIQGDKRVAAMLKELQKLGSVVTGATLNGRARDEGGNNYDVARGFIEKHGRDFFNTQAVADEAAKAFAVAAEARMKAAAKTTMKAGAVAAYAWTEAMKAAMKQAAANIESGTFDGGGSTTLDEAYEKIKQSKFGFAYPIGKATGQLLDNLAPSNYGNIRLKRGKA